VLAFAQRDEMVVHANIETGEILFQRVLFPDGEWLAWNPAKAFYMASPRGHEHARVRFADQLTPVYPLDFYRAELSRQTNLLAALAGSAPVIQPKNFRLWWHRYPYKQAWLTGGLALAGLWIAHRLRHGWIAERRRRAQERISRQLFASQEAERKRIAAELHDSLGQNLLIIKNRLYLAQQNADDTTRATQLQDVSQTVSQTIEEVREISHNLRPYQLDRLGLTKAVQSVLKKISDSGSLAIAGEIANIDGLFPPDGEINLYRIVQESLNNIVKHADAATARVAILRADSRLTMSIEDDGRGFDYRHMVGDEHPARGFGLTGLGERVRILGGSFECDSAPGRGTRLKFEIPIPQKR
jgi:signal transduction histidine kinase